jgi:mono/diheme cytochrome c family protein
MRAGRSLALVAGLVAAGAGTAGSLDMVAGRMVQARPDAPAVATTTHVRARFVLHCAGCHGVDGTGSKLGYVPDMRQLGGFLQVPGGREFVISVPGVMGSGLDDAQVAEVMNWLLATMARGSVPEGLAPFDAAEVARARASPLVDVAATRRRLVEQAHAVGIAIE